MQQEPVVLEPHTVVVVVQVVAMGKMDILYVAMGAPELVVIMGAVVVWVVVAELAGAVEAAQCVSFGPARLANSHRLVQQINNLY